MSLQSLLQFLLLLYISTNGFCANPASASMNAKKSSKARSKESSVIHFEMIHRHDPEILGGRTLSRSDRIKELLHGDKIRMDMMMHKRKLRRNLGTTSSRRRRTYQLKDRVHVRDNSSFYLSMLSGLYAQSATYYIPFKVGTPAQKFLLVADTGSDLTWIHSRLGCNQSYHGFTGSHCGSKLVDENDKTETNGIRLFAPERSHTFKTVPCATRLCQQGLFSLGSTLDCPKPMAPCSYYYNYSSGAEAKGIFAYESITVNLTNGIKKKIHGMMIGVTLDWKKSNPIGLGNADGIFGLGFNSHAFVFNVFKTVRGKFSYCLMDHDSPKKVTNYLTFGHRSDEEKLPHMQFTEMGLINDWYALIVTGIYVDGVKLNIPDDAWDIDMGKGMIIDTGFSLTAFVEEAYIPIMEALEKPLLRRFPRIDFPDFDSCFNITNNENQGGKGKGKGPFFLDESEVPVFEMEFKFGVRFKPPVKSYFIDVDDGVRCIGFVMAPDDGGDGKLISVLGNIMQQNHLWELNPFKSRLGLAPSSCVLSH